MKLVDLRFLRGPNLYSCTPCMLALLDIGIPGARGMEAAATVLQAVRELQRRARLPAGFACVRQVGNAPGQFRIVCGYQNEEVAQLALELVLEGTRTGPGIACITYNDLDRLLAAAARTAPPPGLAAAIAEAGRRGIPVLELDDGSMQFGWGCRQTRASRGDAVVTLPQGDGRIPVIAITGTNGKTTTTLMIAHVLRTAGLAPGVATTEGVFIGGQRLLKGDCTGYWSARDILESREVDFAVLETARGGILKRGLAFDRCDVSVTLNITADHLGMEGVDTIEDLAAVKGVVTRSASRVAVLNAEDPHCAAMTADLPLGVEVIMFAMSPEHPVLLRHLAAGKRGLYLHDRSLVIADGTLHDELLTVDRIPATLDGRARYNTANALAAAAALLGAGLEKPQIAAGLSGFQTDGRSNPLRTNIFEVNGITAVVDYAHNPAAYAALGAMARQLGRGKLVGVVTACGDRRDADLEEIGATCARAFDQLVVYESQSRGRAMGGTVEVIVRGALKPGGRALVMEEWRDIDAIRRALALCTPGDVLVFACGTSLATFVEALRLPEPAAAERIAAAIALPFSGAAAG